MPSDIKVFVRWKDQTIFAGEDVECTITFKNVAENNSTDFTTTNGSQQRRPSRPTTANTNSESYFSLKSPQSLFFHQNRRSHPLSPRKKPPHRVSSSLSSPFGPSHSFPPAHTPPTPRNWQPPNHKHKRSVSILSIDSEGGGEKAPGSSSFNRFRPTRHHARSASLQVLPRRNEAYEDVSTKGIPHFAI